MYLIVVDCLMAAANATFCVGTNGPFLRATAPLPAHLGRVRQRVTDVAMRCYCLTTGRFATFMENVMMVFCLSPQAVRAAECWVEARCCCHLLYRRFTMSLMKETRSGRFVTGFRNKGASSAAGSHSINAWISATASRSFPPG